MNDASQDLEKAFKKFFTDLFIEKDGDIDRESVAFAAAFVSFMVVTLRSVFHDGNWDAIGFGFGAAAILIGGGAAIGAKLKNAAAMRQLESRIERLEKLSHSTP